MSRIIFECIVTMRLRRLFRLPKIPKVVREEESSATGRALSANRPPTTDARRRQLLSKYFYFFICLLAHLTSDSPTHARRVALNKAHLSYFNYYCHSLSLTKTNCHLIRLIHSFSFQTTAKHNASNYFLLDAL